MRPENTASRRNLVSLAGCPAARHAKRRYGVFPYGRQSEPKADRLSEVRIGAVGSACPPDPTPRVCNIRRRGLLDSPLEGDGFELLVPPGRNSTRAPCGFRARPPASRPRGNSQLQTADYLQPATISHLAIILRTFRSFGPGTRSTGISRC